MGWTLKSLVALALFGLSGCATLTDHHYEKTQRARAREAWRQHGSKCKNQLCERDYAAGWKDGFYDIATGGKGCPPVVAPCRYWSPSQILDDHDQRRLAYYNGFQDGVACSLQYPQTHYLKVWSSCECPLPQCENQCAPCAPCGSVLPAPCGIVLEGTEYLIEDDYVVPEPAAVPAPAIGPVQQAEPVVVPELRESVNAATTGTSVAKKGEPRHPGTSVRFSEPVRLDEYGLATPEGESGQFSYEP